MLLYIQQCNIQKTSQSTMSLKNIYLGLPDDDQSRSIKKKMKLEAKLAGIRFPYFTRGILSDYVTLQKKNSIHSQNKKLCNIIREIESKCAGMEVESRHLWEFLLRDLLKKLESGELSLVALTSTCGEGKSLK